MAEDHVLQTNDAMVTLKGSWSGEAAPVAPVWKWYRLEECWITVELIGWAGKGEATPGMDCALQKKKKKRMDEPDRVGWHASTPYGGLYLAVVGCFIY